MAIAFGKNERGKRIYSVCFPFCDGVADADEICEAAKEGLFDVKYFGPSLDEMEQSVKGLQRVTKEKMSEILREEVERILTEKLLN